MLQENGKPVPVPKLAQELSVSPVSANEMCRKLAEKNLITYEPYKGVKLTASGIPMAQRVLRHRRLWEVFFVTKLNIKIQQAEEMACRFEHVTPELLADRLDRFLDYPTHSPQNLPIPARDGKLNEQTTQPITTLTVGETAQVVSINADSITQEFLHRQGLGQGITVTVLSTATDGSLLLKLSSNLRLSISNEVGADINVSFAFQSESAINAASE